MLTPPSTANDPRTVQLPDFQKSKIVLSPIFIDDVEIKEPLRSQLTNLGARPSSLRQATEHPQSDNILHSTPRETKDITLLVRLDDRKDHVRCMTKIYRSVVSWHPIPVHVWDRQILEVLEQGFDKHDEEARKDVAKLYMAELVYIPHWWDEDTKCEGAVEIRWADRPISHAPTSTFGVLVEMTEDPADEGSS